MQQLQARPRRSRAGRPAAAAAALLLAAAALWALVAPHATALVRRGAGAVQVRGQVRRHSGSVRALQAHLRARPQLAAPEGDAGLAQRQRRASPSPGRAVSTTRHLASSGAVSGGAAAAAGASRPLARASQRALSRRAAALVARFRSDEVASAAADGTVRCSGAVTRAYRRAYAEDLTAALRRNARFNRDGRSIAAARHVAAERHRRGGLFAYVDMDVPQCACVCGGANADRNFYGWVSAEQVAQETRDGTPPRVRGTLRAFRQLAAADYAPNTRWAGLEVLLDMHESQSGVTSGMPSIAPAGTPLSHVLAAPSLFFHGLGYDSDAHADFDVAHTVASTPPWDVREPRAVWRGHMWAYNDTDRRALLRAARARPDLFDVEPCNTLPQPEDAPPLHTGGGCPARLSSDAMLRYKFAPYTFGFLNYFSSRLKPMLAGGFVVLIPQFPANVSDSRSSAWYERYLRPNVHYWATSNNFADAAQQLEWLRAHDDRAEWVATRAQRFAQMHLSDACSFAALEAALDTLKDAVDAARRRGALEAKQAWVCPNDCSLRPFLDGQGDDSRVAWEVCERR